MSRIYLINAKKQFAHSNGKLNNTLHQVARETFEQGGHETRDVVIDHGYDPAREVENYLWADIIIYQFPGWWMGPPWILKKYIDDVFTEGHGRLYASDGRTRSDSSRKYGSGGLVQGKRYLLSSTWNAPTEAFEQEEQFFEGRGIDGVLLPLHKANQFLGMTPLPSFMCNNVIKDPRIEEDIERYKAHLGSLPF